MLLPNPLSDEAVDQMKLNQILQAARKGLALSLIRSDCTIGKHEDSKDSFRGGGPAVTVPTMPTSQ